MNVQHHKPPDTSDKARGKGLDELFAKRQSVLSIEDRNRIVIPLAKTKSGKAGGKSDP